MLVPSSDGKARANDSELPPPQRIACGNAHTLCLEQTLSDGAITIGTKVFGFGSNRNKQLGFSPSTGPGEAERYVTPQDPCFRVQHDQSEPMDLFEVACGSSHSLVLERQRPGDNGSLRESCLWAFGLNASGQLGRHLSRGDPENSEAGGASLPIEVTIPDVLGSRIVVQRICCGSDHTLVLTNFVGQSGATVVTAGRVFAWGLSGCGALGTRPRADASVPNEVWFPSDIYDEDDPRRSERVAVIKQVAAGAKHSVALGANGSVYTWGHGGNGRLGLGASSIRGSNSYSAAFEPQYVEALKDARIKYISVGEAHSGAVDQLGGLHTWGQGSHGRCGHGVTLDVSVPTRVESLTGVAIKQIALGLMHSIATTMKGQLYAWGKGPATGLDAHSNAVIPVPRLVEMPDRDPVHQIAAGPLHTVVLMCDGTLYCFGSASEGRLPFKLPGGPKDQTFPKKLDCKGWSMEHERQANGTKGKAKAAGEEKSKDHEWWPGHVISGGAHSAVLCEGGQTNLWFWGARTLTGATEAPSQDQAATEREHTWQPSLLKRGFLNSVKMVAIGLEHCLAITIDGQMYSWGNGEKGQLGSGNLQVVMNPQPVGHPTDVICVSAGEEHSACIIEGGEAYLWGNAEGGRLGLGNCLSEGVQLMPKQVVITDVTHGTSDAQAALLRNVACGSQHTAFINEDNRLLTFGMGWFGRLGHGNLENHYSPSFVRSVANLQTKSVHCALYHTCIVDENDVLWVCGRDSSICRDGKGHQTEPMKFEPFMQEPRRYIQSVATSEEHTLAITFQKPQQGSPELWVWGKNNRGQLGLPTAAAPRIDIPWQLRIPDLENRKKSTRHDLRMVSTAPGHSLCLVVVAKYNARLQEHVEEPIVYAWGYSGSGRLGLVKDVDERLQKQHDQCMENSLVSGSPHAPVYPPMRVEPRWKPEETIRRHGRGGDPDDEVPSHLLQASQTWYDVQRKLHGEPQDQKPRSLEETAREVSKLYEGYMREVCSLWDKPTGTDIAEYSLRQKQREIECEFIRTLKVLKLGMSMCAPKLQGRVKTDPEILQQLPRFEQLIWVLQQQPLYMANLALCLWGKKTDEAEALFFHRVAEALYSDLKDPRTLHLFKALLRVMIENETTRATSLEEAFDPTKSRVATLFTQLSTNIHMIDRVAMSIVDPERESSLISIIIKYTICKEDGVTPRNYKESKSHAPDFSGVFVCKWKEYEELLLQYRSAGGGEKARPEQIRRSRQHFANELRCFKDLCVREPGDEAADGEEHDRSRKGLISDFIGRFIKDTLKKEEDIKMLLVKAFTHLTQRPYVINQKADDADAWRPGVCSPITSLVLAGILGGVLNAVNNEGQFSLVRLKISQQVRKKEAELVTNGWNRGKDDSSRVELDPEGLIHRVFFNIQALANFFKRVVAPKGYSDFGKDGVIEKEEPMARDCAQTLHQFTNETILSMLQEKSVPGSKSFTGRSREYGDDTTETQLTVDLYTAHYSLKKTFVSLSTADLLELTNLLWKYVKTSSLDKEGSAICISDDPENDAVCKLVKEILPSQKQKGSNSESVPVRWSPEQETVAREHGEYHNFTITSRFLEFDRTGDHEPTFCDGSQAPIPRFMAKESQKGVRTVHAVKPLRNTDDDKGPDGAFEFLEELLQDLSGNSKQHSGVRYRIEGRSFQELGSDFQEFQQQISQDVEEGRVPPTMSALLQRLEDGKRMIDKVRDYSDERSLRAYIDKQVRRRSEYHQYLFRVKTGANEITMLREKYQIMLKSNYAYLSHLHSFTVTCEIPDDILAMAQQHSERLAFEKARVKKSRMRRNQPTPAQKVLESLKNETKDGKITDELREQVGFPATSFKFRDLVQKGVIVRMHEKLPRPVQQQMDFTFQLRDEGWVVQAYMKTTLFKEFTISRQDMQLLQAGRKCAVWSYGEDFVWVNCFRLMRLLAWIYAEGAL